MKLPISIALATLTIAGTVMVNAEKAGAVVYCTYIGYPANCVVRPGVVLRPRPVVRQGVVGAGTVNRGGPVNRAGRR